jgi:Xaa-Pro aminopeptidase
VVPADEVAVAVADDAEVDHLLCYGEPPGLPEDSAGPFARSVRRSLAEATRLGPDALATALERLGVREGVVAIDDARLSANDRQRIAGRLAHLELVGGSAHFGMARRVKGPFEIECLAGALGIAEEALNEVVQMLKRGVTEREATTLYYMEILKRGGEPAASSITMGDRTALGGVRPSERALRAGELVRLDVGCVNRGFVARVGRTAVLGEPTPEQEALHGAVQAALEAAVDAAAPGRAAREVHAAARGAMREGHLPGAHRAPIGHGIGLELEELPELAPDDPTPLEPGEVLSIEIRDEAVGRRGLLARDTVLVTVDGARVLNRSSRGLVSLD